MQTMLYLPIILTVIFTAIYLYDKSRGGYKEEVLIQDSRKRLLKASTRTGLRCPC
jgi:hypothetical protein